MTNNEVQVGKIYYDFLNNTYIIPLESVYTKKSNNLAWKSIKLDGLEYDVISVEDSNYCFFDGYIRDLRRVSEPENSKYYIMSLFERGYILNDA